MTATSRGFHRDIDSLGEVFSFLETSAEMADVGDRDTYCINLVVEELFTNMVKYNQGGAESIAVSVERLQDRLHLELVDRDVEAFDPSTAAEAPVTAGLAERRRGGLGLHLVKSMVDTLQYDYDDETRRLRISVTKILEH